MGVTGLWRLVEPAGKPVPIETLENKVLAVDISIWLHQMVKGYQDAKGAPMANAHLLGLFQRLCKLLYYRIKPVFVFDGAFPDLKKETIAKRHDNKAKLNSESERLRREILLLLGKKTAVGSLLGKQPSPTKPARADAADDLFKLPALEASQEPLSSESESEEEYASAPVVDLHSVDINSDSFKSLPLREKHDLLIELKETRKMNSWGKLHELPKDSDNFSDYQMNRLLKRRKVQECLEETEKEIGGDTMTLNELETLLNEEGINTNIESLPTKRIASNNTTRYLLISNVKKALEDAKKLEEDKCNSIEDQKKENQSKEYQEKPSTSKHDELDDDLQKAIQMSLECADDEDKPECARRGQSPNSTFMLDSDYSTEEEYSSEEEYSGNFEFTSAKAYIMQNSDFTSNAIKDIISSTKPPKIKYNKNRVDEIIKELNQEVPLLPDDTILCNKNFHIQNEKNTIDLSSSDDECEELSSGNKSNLQQDIVIVNTTIEDSDISAIEDHVKNIHSAIETIKVDSDSDQEVPEKNNIPAYKTGDLTQVFKENSDSDEDFEEVPETNIIHTMSKPAFELNLEIKDTIEDDIFADVFENPPRQDAKSKENKNEIVSDDENEIESMKTFEKGKQNVYKTVLDANILKCDMKQLSESITSEIDKDLALSLFDNSEKEDNSLKVKEGEKQTHAENTDINNINENKTIKNAPLPSGTEETISTANHIKDKNPLRELTTQQLNSMEEQLQTDHENLVQEKSRLDRMGRNITEEMTRDAQELLQIFGIPYVVAPTEAEAQCAFLEEAKLTDGTITDDSDIWLFGGKTVYKNFFNQKKHVVQFLAERIEKSFNLSREQLILLALLVGSDYTTGVSGVGPVTAMEVLAAFSGSRRDVALARGAPPSPAKYAALLGGLHEFKRWVRAGKRTDDTSLRKKLKNVAVTDDFPSLRVVQAYMEPKIEKSEEKFTWGEPDVTILREFTRKKFGWSQNKLDEILNPVLKRMEERKSQKSMQDYFKRKIEFHSLEDQMSKRVKAAVEKMGPNANSDAVKTDMEPPKKAPRKRKPKAKVTDASPLETLGTEVQDIVQKPSTSKSSQPTGVVTAVTVHSTNNSGIDILVPKLARYQEIIPQREKDRMNVLQNKMKAIEVFRKTRLDKRSTRKRKINLPKENANLSESDSD